MKKCTKCKLEKEDNCFSLMRGKPRSQCKDCQNAYFREKRKVKGPESPIATRKRYIKYVYGITESHYDNLLTSQEGKCSICETNNPSSKHGFFSIDHCHSTGKIRGLLCQHCNKGLGMFKDDVAILQQAIEYLRKTL
jgi:hypothetical protein